MTAKFMTLEESRASGWKFYHAAMRGQDFPIHPQYVPVGFFRVDNRHKDKSWPLAIWEAEGRKYARVGEGTTVDLTDPKAEEDFAYNTFQYCCKKPIDFKAYEHWMANRAWPEATGTAAVIEASKATRVEPAGIGDNSGTNPAIEHETWVDQVRAALAGVLDLKTVADDEQAAAANSLRNRLTELASEGGKKHEVEKKPHLEAGRAVDAKWNPVISEARAGASTLKRAIEDHHSAKLRKQREEEAARAAAANPVVEAPKPERIESTYGKATTVKTRKVAVVTDFDEVYQQVKGHPDVQALLQKLAQKMVDAGGSPRGVTAEERAAIR